MRNRHDQPKARTIFFFLLVAVDFTSSSPSQFISLWKVDFLWNSLHQTFHVYFLFVFYLCTVQCFIVMNSRLSASGQKENEDKQKIQESTCSTLVTNMFMNKNFEKFVLEIIKAVKWNIMHFWKQGQPWAIFFWALLLHPLLISAYWHSSSQSSNKKSTSKSNYTQCKSKTNLNVPINWSNSLLTLQKPSSILFYLSKQTEK